MGVRQVAQQIHGILGMRDVQFLVHEDEDSFLVWSPEEEGDESSGSAAVYVDVHESGDLTMVSLYSYVLENVDAGDAKRLQVLEALNELNADISFGKFYLDDDDSLIMLEYDLLGEDLDEDELLHALVVTTGVADRMDDELREKLGTGERARDAWKRKEAEMETEGTAIDA